MVRCSKCSKSFKQHSGICWNDNMCNKCWNMVQDLEYTPPPKQTSLMSNEFDFYLDKYTLREMENMKS